MSEQNFYERLKNNPRPVVVDFWAPWCGPCRMVEPMLKKIGGEYDGQVDVWKVNADEHPDLLRELRIFGIPTLIGFNAGQEIARQTGVGSPAVMSGLFDAALSGEVPQAPEGLLNGLTIIDRLMRAAIGLALFFLAYTGDFSGIYLLIAILGGAAIFSAVHDRCPVWQAIKPRLKALVGGDKASKDDSA